MARKKKSAAAGTKGEAVRQYLADHPGAGPKETAEGLRAQGIDVSVSLVSQTKAKLAGKGPAKKTTGRKKVVGPRTATPAAPVLRNGESLTLTAADLIEAKKLADQLGGLAQARRALETLEKLR